MSQVEFSFVMTSEAPVKAETLFGDEPASIAVRGLRKKGRIVGMTKGQFSLLDLIRAVLDHTGPASLSLSTWTAGIRDARNAGLLLDKGVLTGVRLLVDRSFASRQPAYCKAVTKMFGAGAIRCTRTHAKIAIIRNAEWAVVIRSSMNLNRNPRFEQYDIDESPELADFFGRHFEQMEQEMPEGARVATREVDAVFDRVRRGLNPFDSPSTKDLAGVPLEGQQFGPWVRAAVKGSNITFQGLRDRVGCTHAEMSAVLADPETNMALAEDIGRVVAIAAAI